MHFLSLFVDGQTCSLTMHHEPSLRAAISSKDSKNPGKHLQNQQCLVWHGYEACIEMQYGLIHEAGMNGSAGMGPTDQNYDAV